MHESLQMYTFLERKFREKYNFDIIFYQKSAILRKSQKTRFLPFFFQNRLQKNWNSKNCFGIVLLT